MGLSIGRQLSIKFRILPTLIMAFALVAQPLYGFVSSQAVDAASSVHADGQTHVDTAADLQAAFNDANISHITLDADITTTEELILARDDVRFNGNDKTISYTGLNPSGWNGLYVLQVYGANNVELNSVRVAGGDAGILVNGSIVTVKGNTHPLNNEFGGIEVSKGSAASNSVLTLQGNLWDEGYQESNGKPAVWLENGQGSVVTTSLNSPLTIATHIKPTQTQYYLRAVNTGTVATNTTTGQTFPTLQAAFTAANVDDTVVLNKNTTVESGAVANLINKKITFDGQGNTIETLGARGSAGDQKNAGLIVESTADGTTVQNLTLKGIGGTTAAHGIIVHDANGTFLQNITATNNAGGVMILSSVATLDTINTRDNAWYGINIDKVGAVLTIKGVNTHNEATPLFVDNRNIGQVIDQEKRYDIISVGNTDTYVIDTTAPSISWQVQPAPLVKNSFAVRPITNEVGTLKSIYFDTISAATLCWTLNSDHMNFDTSEVSCPAVFASLNDGTHKFIAVFSDANGNGSESASNTFILDRTGPSITVKPESVGTAGVYKNVSFKLFDTNQVDKIMLNGVVKDLTNNNYSDLNNVKPGQSGAIEGNNVLIAYDVLGNATADYGFTLDTVNPSAPVTVNPSGFSGSNDIEFSWAPSSDAHAVTYELITGKHPNVDSNGKLSASVQTVQAGIIGTSFANDNMADGPYFWQVRSKDQAGNYSAWSNVGVLTVDTTAPAAPTLITPNPYYENGPSKTLSWNASSSNDVKYYEYAEYVNTAPDSDTTVPSWTKDVYGTSTTDTAWNSDVTIYWRVRAVDYLGHKSVWSEMRTIITDHTMPEVPGNPVTSPNPTNASSALWNWGASEGDALSGLKGYEYVLVKGTDQLDSSSVWTDTTNTSANLSFDNGDGTYMLYVRSKDNAGNVSNSTSGQVSVDTKGPVVGITNVVRNNNGTYTISGTTDDTSSVDVALTSGANTTSQSVVPINGGWSVTTGVLASGQYVAKVASVDSLNNESDAGLLAATRTFTVAQIVNPVSTVDLGTIAPLSSIPAGTIAGVSNAAATQNAGVANVVTTPSSEDTDGEVLGTQDSKSSEKVAAISPSEQGWKIFGIAWYWWLLILAAIAAIWWAIAGYRRRNSEQA